MSEQDFLTGAGHFGFGFIGGAVLLVLLLLFLRKNLFVQMYAPFLPFVVGFVAVLPYLFVFQKTCNQPFWANVFFLYSWVHCQSFIVAYLSNLHFVALICGAIYSVIILRYIFLVKRIRRNGWYKKGRA